MAIRFHCKRCHQLLGIATRKAGTEIKCPKCGFPQTVPSEEAAGAATAMAKSAQAHQGAEGSSGEVVYEDEPTLIGPPLPPPAEQAAPAPPPASASALPPPLPDLGQPVPQGMILYPRRTIYFQGLLFFLLAAVAFTGGYLIGHGDASLELQVAHQQSSREEVLVEGRLSYQTDDGKIAADSDAVIILLPHQRFPEGTLPIDGLRPRDPDPDESSERDESVRAIEDLGGAYTRADDAGHFATVLPEEGPYRVLLISRHATRAKGTEIDELALIQIQEYFRRANDLIDPSKYRWMLEEIRGNIPPIEHNFGRDEGE